MTILVASVYCINSYSRGIMPDCLQSLIDRYPRAKIYYLSCSNSFDVCYFNPYKAPEICYRCKTGLKNSLNLVKGKFRHKKIQEVIKITHRKRAREFFRERKVPDPQLVYENFEIGPSTMSTYYSVSRDRDLAQIADFPMRELSENALALYLGLRDFLREKQVDRVYNFNGRQEYVRAVFKAALAQGVTCYNLERPSLGGHIEAFKDSLPHDPRLKARKIREFWEGINLGYAEKCERGMEFFHRQRRGERVLFPAFARSQHRNELPPYIRNGNKNIVVYSSSDDEFAAFGKEFQNPYFRDQNEGLAFLTRTAGLEMPETNLIIRMHPNLKGLHFSYVKFIRQLHQLYPNIYVIPSEATVDTYALMDKAEKVISFGSTTGMEAAVWGKPVILLGRCFYYEEDFVYKPADRDQIISLLKDDLKPKDPANALKYGLYYLEGGKKSRYYYEDRDGLGIFFKGRRVLFFTPVQRVRAKLVQIAYDYFGLRFNF